MSERKVRRVNRGGLGGNTQQNVPKVKKACPFAKQNNNNG